MTSPARNRIRPVRGHALGVGCPTCRSCPSIPCGKAGRKTGKKITRTPPSGFLPGPGRRDTFIPWETAPALRGEKRAMTDNIHRIEESILRMTAVVRQGQADQTAKSFGEERDPKPAPPGLVGAGLRRPAGRALLRQPRGGQGKAAHRRPPGRTGPCPRTSGCGTRPARPNWSSARSRPLSGPGRWPPASEKRDWSSASNAKPSDRKRPPASARGGLYFRRAA